MDLTLKYRPKSFAEVIGQESIISILSRQIATKTWKNAYLFCGSFGCGKTTCARIFADAINDGEGMPIEIDGASHNGVKDIRELIVDAQQTSIECKYKVYVVDECHMITSQAWNAALKLIEEPPAGVVFIFCTTNPEKLPQTILSRVQRFDFKRVSRESIADRLEFILNEECHTKYERIALDRIASISDGHVRDAIKLLDKCLSNTDDITLENVETILGLFKYNSIVNIIVNSINGNLLESVKELDHVKALNGDMLKFYDALIEFAIDSAIYAKNEHTEFTSISEEIRLRVPKDFKRAYMLVERLLKYRAFANQYNAETFLRTVMIEMCEVQ